MVLEEATSPQEPATYSEALPSSDLDPYEAGNPPYTATREPSYIRISALNSNAPVYVNLNTLPRPFSPFGERRQSQALANSIQETCRFATGVLHRPVTQEEADAFAFHLGKSIRVASYGEPIGFAIAMAQAYRTNAELRFPLWSPMKSGRFSPDKFGPFKGAIARMQWQALRIGAYGTVGAIFGSIFFGSYAMSIGLAGRAMDPRLKEFTQAIRKRMENRRGSVSEEVQKAMGEAEEGPKKDETSEMARQRAVVQRIKRGARRKETMDDMSPTSGGFEDDVMGQASSDTGVMNDGQASQQPGYSYDMEKTPPQPQTVNSTSSSTSSSQSPPSKPSGSAWDRLRQNAMSGGQNTSSTPSSRSSTRPAPSDQSSRGGSGGSDSFSFSQGEEDKQLARSEAQKDFDNRIAREREGKDFEEGQRDRRW